MESDHKVWTKYEEVEYTWSRDSKLEVRVRKPPREPKMVMTKVLGNYGWTQVN